MKRFAVLSAIIILSVPAMLFGGSEGTSSADFLKIGAGARPSAMGEAFTGVADDSNATFWNPAGITAVEKISVTYMYLLWYQSQTYHYFSYVMPLDAVTNFGISANALITPGFDSTGGFAPAEPASYDIALTSDTALLLAGDIIKPVDLTNPDFQKWYFGLGAEAKLFGVGFIRGGYEIGKDGQGLTAGGGLSWGWGSLDYAFLPHLDLGNTHRISVTFKFGNTVARPLVGAPQQPQRTTAIAGDKVVSVGWDPNPEGNITEIGR